MVQGQLLSPKADQDLERRVANCLYARHLPGLRHLNIEADRGTVRVSGQVSSFHEKQIVQHVCRHVAGVLRMVDDVEVAKARPVEHSRPRRLATV